MIQSRVAAPVPRSIRLLLIVGLATQIAWHATQDPPQAAERDLPPPPARVVLEVLALGEPAVFARVLMLWLQAFDSQPGLSLPFARLDYTRLEQWLARILALDPRAHYPLLAASRVYAEVADPDRQRLMLEFVHAAFLEDPAARWQWLAHAVFVAKHRLRDRDLALRYATDLATLTDPGTVPSFARQMRIFVLEEMGEFEAARVLLGALLASGEVTDPAERWFLSDRLAALSVRPESPGVPVAGRRSAGYR